MTVRRYEHYADYLQSDHWQRIRARALRAADHRCQVCNSGGPLEVHHRTYDRVPYRERPEDLTVLCATCHGLYSERMAAP